MQLAGVFQLVLNKKRGKRRGKERAKKEGKVKSPNIQSSCNYIHRCEISGVI